MKNQTLFIMCGYPFAGKSTLVRKISKEVSVSLVSTDMINRERNIGLVGKEITPKQWEQTYALVYQRMRILLNEGKAVVYDDCNFTKKQRDKAREIAKEFQVIYKIIYIPISKDEAYNRWQENRKVRKRFDIRDEDFMQVADNFQIPAEEKDVIVYNQNDDPDEWIRKNICA